MNRVYALSLSAAVFLACAPCTLTAHAAAQNAVPDFYTSGYGWQARTVNTMKSPAGAPGAPGPIGAHPDHPAYGNNNPGGDPSPRIANDRSPLLQPWAAELLKKRNATALAGGVVFTPVERCWPTGVPGVLNIRGAGVVFLQQPDKVTMIYTRGMLARHVSLNKAHAKNLKPNWYGEAVGHYDGDAFVVDSIGFNDKSPMDTFGVPHTTQLHTVERYRIVDGSPSLITGNPDPKAGDAYPGRDEYFIDPKHKVLQVIATVDDPGTFTSAYSMQQLYWPSTRFEEDVCSENNDDHLDQGLMPVPHDDTPDF